MAPFPSLISPSSPKQLGMVFPELMRFWKLAQSLSALYPPAPTRNAGAMASWLARRV